MEPSLLFAIAAVVIAILWLIGTPIFVSFLAGAIFFLAIGNTPLSFSNVPALMFGKVDSWVLIAIPLFVLAGQLMAETGISRYLVDFMDAFLGWMPGGLWVASAVAGIFFSAMNGSGPATTVAIGSVMMGPLVKKGYHRGISMGLIASVGTLGNLIPPSIGLIIIGALAAQDVSALFLGAIIPGLIIGVALCIIAIVIAIRKRYVGSHYTWKQRGIISYKAIPSLMTPVIILGGIYSGVFTPTEAAGVACVWAFLTVFIYREATFAAFRKLLYTTMKTTCAIYLLIGSAMVFSMILVYLKMPQALMSWVATVGLSATGFLVFSLVLWMVLALFLDGSPILLISLATLWPVALQMGIHPIHYAVLMQACIVAGQATPPFALNVFAITSIAKAPLEEAYKGVIPFCIVEYAVLMGILFFPQVSLFLPKLWGAA